MARLELSTRILLRLAGPVQLGLHFYGSFRERQGLKKGAEYLAGPRSVVLSLLLKD